MKFNYNSYNILKENCDGDNAIYFYSDDDLNECMVVVDKDGNILKDEPTGECACISCRGGA